MMAGKGLTNIDKDKTIRDLNQTIKLLTSEILKLRIRIGVLEKVNSKFYEIANSK
jgi:hypothetical protein